jgi:hypothetical protein
MLLAAGLTFNATFAGSLALFLFFFISTLAAFEIRRASRQVGRSKDETITRQKPSRRNKQPKAGGPEARREPRVRYLVAASAGQILMIALLTLPLFFLIPRLGSGGLARNYGEAAATTGFTEQVKLGDVAKIKTNPRVVMRVQLNETPQKYIRWRGVALERYEAGVWSLTALPEQRTIHLDQGGAISGASGQNSQLNWVHALVRSSREDPPPRNWPSIQLDQRFVLEPIDTHVMFAANKPVRLQGPVANLFQDRYTGEIRGAGFKGRIPYTVTSDIGSPSIDQLRADTPSPATEIVKKLWLQLPRLDPRIALLAHQVTRNESNAYDKAKAIETYLKTQFQYTLDIKAGSKDPLAEFLFDLKEGHCEYFASAMVIMLRTLDIPARIVNGFQMGEHNELNNYYTVRESDAHSWVEVYFPHFDAWIEFDPTPSAGINDYSKGGVVARMRRYADALEVFWLDYVVTLDRDQQASLMVELQHRLLGVKRWAQLRYNALKLYTREFVNRIFGQRKWELLDLLRLMALAALAGLVGMTAYIASAHRKRRRLPPTGYGPWWHRLFIVPRWRHKVTGSADHRESAVLFYEQMLAVARRAGFVKATHQTPLEFASACGVAEIGEITSFYNRVRFGGSRLNEDEAQRVSRLISDLKHQIRRRNA